ncbi:MAG: LysM peptidoglycan-binding domain-containing protein [Christensenellales bacterium]
MIAYVVQPGDSLFTIARRFGVSADDITAANELGSIPYLVVGQTLLIPAKEMAYTAKQGDSVFAIARRFGVPMAGIVRLNNLSEPYLLKPGTVLRIPVEEKNYGTIEVNAYIEPTTPNPAATINAIGPYLTYISPFSYTVNADGSLNPIDDTAILSAARRNNISPLMVVTNFAGDNFSTPIVDAILTNPAAQQTLINNMLRVIREKGYYGLNIDFERISPANGPAYTAFLKKVMAAFKPQNIPVSVALAPKTSGSTEGTWHGAHDYPSIGNTVDFVILMTYEWGWSGGPPYAVAPVDLVEDVIKYAVSVIPPNKIMMGMPLYGYDWTLPYVKGGPFAKRISPQQAVILAARENARIEYDAQTQSPHFNYFDAAGKEHVVWFEDVRSTRAKLMLVNKYGLRGISFWVLGPSFPQVWRVVDSMFKIVKI